MPELLVPKILVLKLLIPKILVLKLLIPVPETLKYESKIKKKAKVHFKALNALKCRLSLFFFMYFFQLCCISLILPVRYWNHLFYYFFPAFYLQGCLCYPFHCFLFPPAHILLRQHRA